VTLFTQRSAWAAAEDLPVEKVLVVGESWLAAGCIVSPDLCAGTQQELGTDRIMATSSTASATAS
jgi:hypothetical protein